MGSQSCNFASLLSLIFPKATKDCCQETDALLQFTSKSKWVTFQGYAYHKKCSVAKGSFYPSLNLSLQSKVKSGLKKPFINYVILSWWLLTLPPPPTKRTARTTKCPILIITFLCQRKDHATLKKRSVPCSRKPEQKTQKVNLEFGLGYKGSRNKHS